MSYTSGPAAQISKAVYSFNVLVQRLLEVLSDAASGLLGHVSKLEALRESIDPLLLQIDIAIEELFLDLDDLGPSSASRTDTTDIQWAKSEIVSLAALTQHARKTVQNKDELAEISCSIGSDLHSATSILMTFGFRQYPYVLPALTTSSALKKMGLSDDLVKLIAADIVDNLNTWLLANDRPAWPNREGESLRGETQISVSEVLSRIQDEWASLLLKVKRLPRVVPTPRLTEEEIFRVRRGKKLRFSNPPCPLFISGDLQHPEKGFSLVNDASCALKDQPDAELSVGWNSFTPKSIMSLYRYCSSEANALLQRSAHIEAVRSNIEALAAAAHATFRG